MTVLLIAVVGTLNIVCFFVGAKVGQAVAKGEKIEAPTLNPMQMIQESRERKATEKEQERINTIMRNIESYDGTGIGQEEVPRG